MSAPENARRDRPWVFRTYSGHSSARASNELYRTNLAKGQTGLSVAFDLPTQTGYDSDHPLARGEVGKVGVPICHLDDMTALFEDLPLEKMNTSMTINANAAWLLALYVATAEQTGADPVKLQGTTQNDIVKEYLSRGTYIFPPEASLQLISDIVSYTVDAMPMWNPTNICSYHLQEAGATPVQEIAYAMATAIAVLDSVRARGDVPEDAIPRVVGRISFFLNSGIRFVEEICKVRAMAELWDEIALERYGVQDPKLRRFRYGVQVNSLGLTEAQPENNVIRIVLETLGVTLSKKARCRALQLPAWNEALGLPRPWDQQWSLRIQQIFAFESDLLEYEDLFDGSRVVTEKTRELKEAARSELDAVLEMGGTIAAIENAYMKQRLVESQTARARAIENGELTVVGVNAYTTTEHSPAIDSEGRRIGGARTDRAPRGISKQAEPQGSRGRDTESRRRASQRRQRHARFDPRRTCGRDHGRMVGCLARPLRRIPRPDRRRCNRGIRWQPNDREHARPRAPPGRRTGAPTQDPRRQARSGRPQQRRRADCREGARRGHGGRLRRNPPFARRDRRIRAR
jgi:(2R)-ethylmalonyl-CoA mutase